MKKENLNNGSHTSYFPHHTSSDGITLIALVITIIVMLILVAVSVTMAINGGLFGYAKEGTDKTQAEVDAEQELASGDIVDQWVNGTGENSDETNNEGTNNDKTYVDISALSVGDYISGYPVEYTNVVDLENKFMGWRVLSKGTNYVKIVSAGVPLSYYHPYESGAAATSIANLTTNFLTTEINLTTAEKYKFSKCGFDIGESTNLSNVFTNEFTDKVQSLTKTDVDGVAGSITDRYTNINSDDYRDLLAIPRRDSNYYAVVWLASSDDDTHLWFIHSEGFVYNYYNTGIGVSGITTNGVRPVVTLKSTVKFSPVSEENWINDTTTWEISL